MRYFRNPAFSTGTGGMILVFMAMYGVMFLITQYFQLILGYTPARRGAALPADGADHDHRGAADAPAQRPVRRQPHGGRSACPAWRSACSCSAASASTRRTGTSSLSSSRWSRGIALAMSPMTAAIMSAVPPRRAGAGSAMNDATRELGAALGVAVHGQRRRVAVRHGHRRPDQRHCPPAAQEPARALAGRRPRRRRASCPAPAGQALTAGAEHAFIDGIHLAVTVGAVLAAHRRRRSCCATCPRPWRTRAPCTARSSRWRTPPSSASPACRRLRRRAVARRPGARDGAPRRPPRQLRLTPGRPGHGRGASTRRAPHPGHARAVGRRVELAQWNGSRPTRTGSRFAGLLRLQVRPPRARRPSGRACGTARQVPRSPLPRWYRVRAQQAEVVVGLVVGMAGVEAWNTSASQGGAVPEQLVQQRTELRIEQRRQFGLPGRDTRTATASHRSVVHTRPWPMLPARHSHHSSVCCRCRRYSGRRTTNPATGRSRGRPASAAANIGNVVDRRRSWCRACDQPDRSKSPAPGADPHGAGNPQWIVCLLRGRPRQSLIVTVRYRARRPDVTGRSRTVRRPRPDPRGPRPPPAAPLPPE